MRTWLRLLYEGGLSVILDAVNIWEENLLFWILMGAAAEPLRPYSAQSGPSMICIRRTIGQACNRPLF
jgi:hypothetical protein